MEGLIRKKTVIDMMEKQMNCGNISIISAYCKVTDIPIVYDVDKVINQLKRKSFERYGNGGMGGELVVNLDDAFDIVKGGGIDE